jgi:hypothetical protein
VLLAAGNSRKPSLHEDFAGRPAGANRPTKGEPARAGSEPGDGGSCSSVDSDFDNAFTRDRENFLDPFHTANSEVVRGQFWGDHPNPAIQR